MTKNVIISVYDKTDLDIIAKFLIKKKFTIYSTGGTSDFLKKNNIPHIEISKYTKQKEILGGRVKTLHPKIFGGLLGTTSRGHQKELQSEKIVNFAINKLGSLDILINCAGVNPRGAPESFDFEVKSLNNIAMFSWL